MRKVQYGQTPEGAKVIKPPMTLSSSMTIQWRYTAPNTEPVLQSFDLAHLSPSTVLITDNSESNLKAWVSGRN